MIPTGEQPSAKTNLRTTNRDPMDRRRGMPLGMTLFEVLLVLTLLVVLGSLSAPLLEGSFASIRLRRGTDQILATWSQARTHAIESGTIYQFRFEPDGSNYRAEPWAAGLEVDSSDNRESAIANGQSTVEEIEMATWLYEETLPEEIVFSTAQSVSADELGQRQLTRLDQDNTTEWSVPILFYPDGTTSEASLLLKNSRNVFRRATLRALTGVGRGSELLSQEEINRFENR